MQRSNKVSKFHGLSSSNYSAERNTNPAKRCFKGTLTAHGMSLTMRYCKRHDKACLTGAHLRKQWCIHSSREKSFILRVCDLLYVMYVVLFHGHEITALWTTEDWSSLKNVPKRKLWIFPLILYKEHVWVTYLDFLYHYQGSLGSIV